MYRTLTNPRQWNTSLSSNTPNWLEELKSIYQLNTHIEEICFSVELDKQEKQDLYDFLKQQKLPVRIVINKQRLPLFDNLTRKIQRENQNEQLQLIEFNELGSFATKPLSPPSTFTVSVQRGFNKPKSGPTGTVRVREVGQVQQKEQQ